MPSPPGLFYVVAVRRDVSPFHTPAAREFAQARGEDTGRFHVLTHPLMITLLLLSRKDAALNMYEETCIASSSARRGRACLPAQASFLYVRRSRCRRSRSAAQRPSWEVSKSLAALPPHLAHTRRLHTAGTFLSTPSIREQRRTLYNGAVLFGWCVYPFMLAAGLAIGAESLGVRHDASPVAARRWVRSYEYLRSSALRHTANVSPDDARGRAWTGDEEGQSLVDLRFVRSVHEYST